VGLGDGIKEGLDEGIGVVGRAEGLGDGIKVGKTGLAVGLGEGILDGVVVGFLVVGNLVGLGVGNVEGIAVGDGEGIAEGLVVGMGVVGLNVGTTVGDGVGPHVVQVSSIHVAKLDELPTEKTSHAESSIGGVFNHSPVLGSYTA